MQIIYPTPDKGSPRRMVSTSTSTATNTPNFAPRQSPKQSRGPLLDQILKDSLAEPSLSLKRCNITPSMRRILNTQQQQSDRVETKIVYPIIVPSKKPRVVAEEALEEQLNGDEEVEEEVAGEGELEEVGDAGDEIDEQDDDLDVKLEVRLDEDENGNIESVEAYDDDDDDENPLAIDIDEESLG